LKAQENDIAFAIADGGPGVGLVRKPTEAEGSKYSRARIWRLDLPA
jgi:hypothetical protein